MGDAIDYEATCFLKFLGFQNVVFLVKTSFYFKQNRNVFPIFSGTKQGFGDAAFLRQTVDGHFDGHHIGVICSIFDQIEDRIDVIVRMVQ